MNLVLPVNFGERPCDRLLLSRLRKPGDGPVDPRDKSHHLWMMLQVWRDFAIARDDRRAVPDAPEKRRDCDTVSILEEYCGWTGEAGAFVEAAVSAGFFEIVPLEDGISELVLVGFFPANHSGARSISNSTLGGLKKGLNIASAQAEIDARGQLALFERAENPLLQTFTKGQMGDALFLIHQICRILRWKPPVAGEWQAALVQKALAVMDEYKQEDLDRALKWLANNRESQEVGKRIDFVLDRFTEFVTKGRRDFK